MTRSIDYHWKDSWLCLIASGPDRVFSFANRLQFVVSEAVGHAVRDFFERENFSRRAFEMFRLVH